MKRIILIASALLLCGSAFAQEETPSKFKLYGFIRNYFTADTRAVKAGTEDLYFYMPQDVSMKDGLDQNAGFNWRYLSLTTRLGMDVSGYKFGRLNLSGKVEADFYSLNGDKASTTIAQLRLRQAFMKLTWDNCPVSLTLGQTWHPMGADMPHMTNLETGAPFSPFNRSPQVAVDYKLGDFTFTGSLLYLNHYLPTGPNNNKSKEYFKYGLPEFYLGVAYKKDAILAKLGVDILNTRPYRTIADWTSALIPQPTIEVKSLMTAISPFVFFQYTKGMFQLRVKSILAQSAEHLNLLSGYGIASFNADKTITYTPMQDWASFVSFSYGKKVQAMCMLGYMKQLGTTRDLAGDLWINGAADTKIQQAFRATPTVAWNIGKFTVSLEYNLTAAQFGNSKAAGYAADAVRDARGLFAPQDMHWVLNHRFICMTKFNF